MKLPTPEDLSAAPLWENYVIAQTTQASLGLIPGNAVAVGVAVDGLDVILTCQLHTITDADLDDLREIAQELAGLVGDHVNITAAHEVRESPLITPHDAASWIYVARPKVPSKSMVERRLSALASGAIAPSDAADWASHTMRCIEDADVPDEVWTALVHMSGADLLAGPDTPLHGRKDYRAWHRDFQAERTCPDSPRPLA